MILRKANSPNTISETPKTLNEITLKFFVANPFSLADNEKTISHMLQFRHNLLKIALALSILQSYFFGSQLSIIYTTLINTLITT
ncbi:hypothetical protein SAMN02583745_02802 [Thorsellia anophelis DSM 18579]|uniref:Uncharacterized protein n=1 Tax=Thorsellia anophelis DSM 18579 TaxID=1123402 RepID=A0A1I0FK70_9GAMM|nr:hypothetical protein SAMN02583745_02802 [Thorsellia anophelis DSM 18579]